MRRYAGVFLIGLFLIAHHVSAQNSFGSVLGTVVDQSGAAIANAPVHVKNTATGVVTTVQTQSDGNYTAINLVPGPYVVSVELPGFEEALTKPVTLTVNQHLRINLTLTPGSVKQTVTVSAAGTLIDTATSTISTEISSKQVSDLPLSSRNFMQLMVLSAGTVSDTGGVLNSEQHQYRTQLSGGNVFVGGGMGSSNAYLIDGVDDNDPGFQTPSITPPIDSIQEIRLMNKNYSAEYGGAGSQINIATKSGTNQYHGTVYEFFQNDALDATNYFSVTNPLTGRAKPVLRYNLFGVSVGGPVSIPKIVNGHNKLFFFANYEGTRQHSDISAIGRYPTSAELAGNFASDAPIYDPATGQPFPGNKIPSVDSKAAQIIALGLIPSPNVAPQPGYNTVKTLAYPDNVNQYMVRIDAHFSPKDSLFARYSASSENQVVPTIDLYGGQINTQTGKNAAVSYTRIISNHIVNELRIGFNRPISNREQAGAFGKNIAGSLFNGTDPTPATYGAPLFGFTNYSSVGSGNGPIDYTTTSASLADNVTLIKGAHTLETGVEVGKLFYKEINAYEPRGIVTFTGLFTGGPLNPSGNAIADFDLGLPFSATVNQGNYTGWFNSHGIKFFAQDDWNVSRKLTLNLGIRYEYLAPLQEEHNRVSIFDPTYPGGRLLTPDKAIVAQLDNPLIGVYPSRDVIKPDRNNWAPRIGFSYRPFGPQTVVRGGYGVFYDTFEYNEYSLPVLNAPFQKTGGANGTLAKPISLDAMFPIAPTPEPVAGTLVALALDPNSRTPYIQQWNLDLERELPGNAMFEIGYLGSESTKLHYRREPSQGILSNPGPNATVHFLYPNFVLILEDQTGASSNYNALIARFEKRFDRGYSILAHYTWSKALGIASSSSTIAFSGSPQNSWNPRGDYGPLAFDVTNDFVLSGIWELPFGKNKRYAANLPRGANLLVSGWQINGIYQARSGFPFPVLALDASGTVSGGPRADLVGNPSTKDPARAFNRHAFAQPQRGTFGNSANNLLRGKGLDNLDVSVFKNTYLHGSTNLQFRADAFNALNHTQIGPYPGNEFSLDPNSSFGVYNSVQHQARILQLALKFIF